MEKKSAMPIDFSGKWAGVAPSFAGLGFFLLCVYYFGFTNLIDCSFLQVIFQMMLPMGILAAFTVLWQVKRYNSFQVYSLMGGVYCLLMLIRTFSYSSIIIMILEILLYLAAGAICVLTAFGSMADHKYMTWALLAPVAFRLIVDLFQYVFTLSLISFVQEVAALCGLVAFALFGMCVKHTPKRRG